MTSSLLNLTNRVAIITGAASGIGRATAKLFAAQNAKIIAADINLKGLESLKQELKDNIDIYEVDIANENQVKDYIEDAYNKYKKINILCNIAGIAGGAGDFTEIIKPLHERDMTKFKQTLDVNLYGSIYNAKYVIKPMLETLENNNDVKSTSIINTSSEQAEMATAGFSDYNISKYAIDGLTQVLAAEYGASGIRCNAIKPGWTHTNLVSDVQEQLEKIGGQQAVDGMMKQFMSTVPQERGCCPEEMANMFLFLASDAASFCSGSLMLADGGRSVQYSHFPSYINKTPYQ